MKNMPALAAVAVLAAAPAFAQNPPVRSRTEIQAPTIAQAIGGRNAAPAPAGEAGNRPVAGQSVPEPAVGQAGNRAIAGRRLTTGVNVTEVNDALFAAAAADGGLSELTLSQLGVQRATDPELKQFSERMIEEHTRLNNELRSLTTQKGIRIPDMVDVRSQFCAQSLAGLAGERFDHGYARAQLVAHMEAVATFEAEAERGADPDVKAMAARALPKIKSHLEMIKPIARKYMNEKEGEERGTHATGAQLRSPIR
jgi:putative membrane protein